nr:MAG TPA: hypothetical protein [Caudoviricetes sp.]
MRGLASHTIEAKPSDKRREGRDVTDRDSSILPLA